MTSLNLPENIRVKYLLIRDQYIEPYIHLHVAASLPTDPRNLGW